MNGMMKMFGYSLCLVLSTGASLGSIGTLSSIDTNYLSVLRNAETVKLRALLKNGASANARDAQGNTPLILSAAYGTPATVKLLLDAGADVNAANAAGATALMRGVFDAQRVKLLLAHGANPNLHSSFGNTAVILAARSADSHRTVSLLLDHGAEANATNNWGATALSAACAGGDIETAKILLDRGADPNAAPKLCEEGFLFAGGRTPLAWAAFRGNVPLVRLLISHGAEVNAEAMLGTPLAQAAWADRLEAAQVLIASGAHVDQAGHAESYTPLHWAASSDCGDPALVKLLLDHGADSNRGGGQNVDAFMDIEQTPLMLARRHGQKAILSTLLKSGATNETPDRARSLPKFLLPDEIVYPHSAQRAAVAQAIPLLQKTSIESKQFFLNHAKHQDCVSCHQQFLPMAAISVARKQHLQVDEASEKQLQAMVLSGEFKTPEVDWEALFHPDAVYTKGYELFGMAIADLPACETTDAAVHHLANIQGREGCWFNNLPRPPIQTGDIGATALAVHALKRYPLPGRKSEFQSRIEKARHWLAQAKPQNHDSRAFQILGLGWAGESPAKIKSLAKALVAAQKSDGGWSQSPGRECDAYATGLALYALGVGAGYSTSDPAIQRGRHFLLKTQLEDGSWYVRRRAFPFQPTMDSGFPHGKDSWISAAGTSWAVLALSLPEKEQSLARMR